MKRIYFKAIIFILILTNLMLVCPPPIDAQMMEEYEGVHLVINITTNKLHVYLNNHQIYTFQVATGKKKSQTPEGNFSIITKVENPWYLPKNIAGGAPDNPLGTRWLGLNVEDTNGYKFGIHGTNAPYSIGRNVSSGCIRMRNEDVEWLFEHIPLHTPVIITSEKK